MRGESPHMKKRVLSAETDGLEADRSPYDIEQNIDAAMSRCRALYFNPIFSRRTQSAYEDMLEDLRGEGKMEMIQGNIHYLQQTIREAIEYTAEFEKIIGESMSNHWINKESGQRWYRRFFDPDLLEFVRKQWVREHLPALRQGWQCVAEHRGEIMRKHATSVTHLTESDVPDILKFRNRDAFLTLKYQERENLADEVEGACEAQEQNQSAFYRECRRMLVGWSSGRERFLHPQKVGRWLKRIFAGSYSIAERRSFVGKGTLETFRKEWVKLRCQFDTLGEEIRRYGIPQGFWIADLNTFLSWHVNQRSTYIEEGLNRLNRHKSQNPALERLKADIRHDLDSGDWGGAELLLDQAQKTYGGDPNLRSMKKFLQYHRNDEGNERKNTQNVQQTIEEMRHIVDLLPGRVQRLYVRALKEGYSTFRALTVLMGNRVWVHREGRFLTCDTEIRHYKDHRNKELTRQYLNEGHGDDVEYNIVAGDTAKEGAIRGDGANAQVVYMSPGGEDAVLAHVRSNRSDTQDGARGFLYQTSLVPLGLDYGTHEQIVDHFHQPLKEGLRRLEQERVPFTLSGKNARQLTIYN